MNTTDRHPNSAAATKRPLKRMFDAVPNRYDILNRTLTLGFDERWRRRAALMCLEQNPSRVLDLGCGTGDLALHISGGATSAMEIIGLDYSAAMLEVARNKADHHEFESQLQFVEGDAGSMSFPSDHFDVVGIAFAFRNLTWKNPLKDSALAEVMRVLRPGGAFVIVETSQPTNPILRILFHTYLTTLVASVGGIISGNGGAYRYLAESARRFYDAEEVRSMLGAAGFKSVRVKSLLGGIAAIHVAEKPEMKEPAS